LINLDDSIGLYIPYATSMGKGSSTIRQNFCHTAGWDGITGNTYLTNPSLNLTECVDSIIKYDPLIYKPGSMFKYTGVSMQVAARAAEIATGDKWNNLWSIKIKEPLGLNSTQFGFQNNPRVAGGLVSSPADIIRLAQFILNNGKLYDGTQLIDRNRMEELWKDQTNKAPVIDMPYPFNPPYNNPYNADTIRYGIGTWLDIYNPQTNYQEQISGGGAFGTIMWINRCNNTCGVIFTYSSYSKVWETSFRVIDMVNKIYPDMCNTTSVIASSFIPEKFQLEQNYPNPFNPSTIITYQISEPGHVTLKVFDLLGSEVVSLVDEFKEPGIYNSTFTINNPSFSSGVYFYQLKTNKYIGTKKMISIK
jgi:CubicO group peptidase (beta-lactamase class C family)